jgi:hypothetical protein
MSTTESSVMFNLRQLMPLEQERVAREQEAAQQARAEQQACLEREQRGRAAEAASRAEEQARQEQRAAAQQLVIGEGNQAELLRAQLEAAIAEHTRQQHLNSVRARELEQLHADNARDRGRLLKRAGRALALSCALAGAGQWFALQRTAEARAAAQLASGIAAAQAGELAGLRARLMNAHTEADHEVPPAASEPTRATSAPPRVRSGTPRVRATPTKLRTSSVAPSDLELDGDDLDPIKGL